MSDLNGKHEVLQRPKKLPFNGLAGPGRPKGSSNKSIFEFREAVAALLQKTQGQMVGWLEEVAAKDPAKALDLMAKLAEYAAPKLSRTEVTGPEVGRGKSGVACPGVADPSRGGAAR